jgi:two-component system, OmpR family, response regulator
MAQHTVLIVDDDSHIREVLRYALEKEGITVMEADNGLQGLEKARGLRPDIIVLDVMMPEMNGLDMCRELRKTHSMPILFLSSRDTELDRILGLELGGDDYVVKPFSPRELMARIKAMLRRMNTLLQDDVQALSKNGRLIQYQELSLDLDTYRACWHDADVPLTATEFNLLYTLMQTPLKVFTRDELINADIFKDLITDRTIDSHIRRLRRKFAEVGCNHLIETVHGFGYKLGNCQ